jgi:hypothetical protein
LKRIEGCGSNIEIVGGSWVIYRRKSVPSASTATGRINKEFSRAISAL